MLFDIIDGIKIELSELISYEESDWLDFKREWHNSTLNLIHDILCMSNSDSQNNRYIVIGYDEANKKFYDLNNDHRRKKDDIYNLLNTSNLNRIPDIDIFTLTINDNELDIIKIKKTHYRPYFITKSKSRDNRTINAGSIYTRCGSCNTPIDSTAPENQVQDMWRERFGLDLSPLERMNLYLSDTNNWKHVCDEAYKDKVIYYYSKFPEFTFEYEYPECLPDYDGKYKLPYSFTNTIGNSYQTKLKYKYHTTILYTEDLFLCDNKRFYLLHPHIDYIYYNINNHSDFHVFANSSSISDRNATLDEVDINSNINSQYNQLRLCYNILNSREYYVQTMLNTDVNLYDGYIYYDETACKDCENNGFKLSGKIHLINNKNNIAEELRMIMSSFI